MSPATRHIRCASCSHSSVVLDDDSESHCAQCGALLEHSGSGGGSGLLYVVIIIGFLVFLLSASYYRGMLGMKSGVPTIVSEPVSGHPFEKLPGSP
ncbi:MAG: hypothetical protein O7F12_13070 [Nitrospirae bacterium]|nr:hypothetical protein [Nitrospirota bacterium]